MSMWGLNYVFFVKHHFLLSIASKFLSDYIPPLLWNSPWTAFSWSRQIWSRGARGALYLKGWRNNTRKWHHVTCRRICSERIWEIVYGRDFDGRISVVKVKWVLRDRFPVMNKLPLDRIQTTLMTHSVHSVGHERSSKICESLISTCSTLFCTRGWKTDITPTHSG
jgi:hypothetical protein